MPILPEKDEPPTRAEQLQSAIGRVGTVITGPAPVTVRLVVLLVFAIVGSSMAPVPWNQIAVLSIVGLALEIAARKR